MKRSQLWAGTALLALPLTAPAAEIFNPYIALPTGSWPTAVAIGDVNGDGLNDVALTTSYYFDPENDYKLFVFLQDGSGNLTTPIKYATHSSYTARAESVVIADVTGDGLNDIVIGNGGASIEIFPQDGTGQLAPSTVIATVYSDRIRAGDLNGDGLTDIAGIEWGGSEAGVFLQDLSGNLSLSASYYAPHGGYDDLEIGDINTDGLDDIIVMSGQLYAYDNIAVLLQTATGSFGPAAYYDLGGDESTHGVGVGDVNGDGANDVVVSYGGNRPYSNIAIFAQNGTGTLDPATSTASYDVPEPVEVADLDGDQLDDIIVLHGGWSRAGVYLQQGDGSLAAEALYTIPYASHYNPHGMAVGDINGDRSPDLAIADSNNGLVILTNSIEFVNHAPVAMAGADVTVARWTTVTLDGTASYDPDGTITNYAWQQVSGESVTLQQSGTPGIVSFQAPNAPHPIELVFELTVTDNEGSSATDQVAVTVVKK